MIKPTLLLICGLGASTVFGQVTPAGTSLPTPTATVPSSIADTHATAKPAMSSQEAPRSEAQVLEERGDLQMARKKYREAIDSYAAAIRIGPNNAIAWNKMGIGHHQLLEISQAKADYEKAIRINRKYSEAINN